MSIPKPLSPAAAETLGAWHEIIASGDTSALEKLVHPDATFRSPVAHKPYSPGSALILALSTAITVFEDFRYHREMGSDDGQSAILEFSAKVNGKELKGVDIITFDADGLITEFEVAVRPLSALQALAEEMGQRIGAAMKMIGAG